MTHRGELNGTSYPKNKKEENRKQEKKDMIIQICAAKIRSNIRKDGRARKNRTFFLSHPIKNIA